MCFLPHCAHIHASALYPPASVIKLLVNKWKRLRLQPKLQCTCISIYANISIGYAKRYLQVDLIPHSQPKPNVTSRGISIGIRLRQRGYHAMDHKSVLVSSLRKPMNVNQYKLQTFLFFFPKSFAIFLTTEKTSVPKSVTSATFGKH